MNGYPEYAEYLVEQLYNIGSIRFGEFILKSGLKTPVYFDMRLLVSHPTLLKYTSDLMYDLIERKKIEYDIICGVPYAAISLATSLSLTSNKPMIFRRKDVKSYGTKKVLEGTYNENDRCILIEDVVVYGESILETKDCLVEHNLNITDCITVVDRQQGGGQNIENNGVKYHCLINADQILEILFKKNKITRETLNETIEFFRVNNCIRDPTLKVKKDLKNIKELDFAERAKLCKNKLAKQLFEIMSNKQTNLCLSADVTSMDELLQLANELGPHLCMLKTHVDIIEDFDRNKMKELNDLSVKHNFLIFEDRKFADIGNTVKLQYTKGVHRIHEWSHIVNAHTIAGVGTINALKEASNENGQRACLLIAEMSSVGNLITPDYTSETVQLAEENSDFVIGFIAQRRLSLDPTLLHLSPGIQFNQVNDSLGQSYITPEQSIYVNRSDIAIVGRGIIKYLGSSNEQLVSKCIEYKTAAYNAYLKRLDKSTSTTTTNGFH